MKKLILLVVIIVLCLWIVWGDWIGPVFRTKIGTIPGPARSGYVRAQPC